MKFMHAAIRGVSLGAVLALTVTTASADGYSAKGGPSERPFSWTGFYVGGAVGYGIGTSELSDGFDRADVSLRGAQGILSGGYDMQVSPNAVLGVLVDYAFGDVDGDFLGSTLTISNQWSIGARAGFLVTPKSLWYVNAGWTRADFDISAPGFGFDKSLNGFFVGGGVEQALTRDVSLKLEYRFSDYEDVNVTGTNVDNSVHSVRLGVNWKFH
jgi:outer membrane immunogenic protein